METVVGVFHSYPIFLWITWCKILFIVSDQNWKTQFSVAQPFTSKYKNHYKSCNWIKHVEKDKLCPHGIKSLLIF
ncbi:hypothetical protein FDW86_07630 [Citrobacter sp. wls828]|nr:hypothetical protein FDW86_07630 [Citrobacter sp. wls828]